MWLEYQNTSYAKYVVQHPCSMLNAQCSLQMYVYSYTDDCRHSIKQSNKCRIRYAWRPYVHHQHPNRHQIIQRYVVIIQQLKQIHKCIISTTTTTKTWSCGSWKVHTAGPDMKILSTYKLNISGWTQIFRDEFSHIYSCVLYDTHEPR